MRFGRDFEAEFCGDDALVTDAATIAADEAVMNSRRVVFMFSPQFLDAPNGAVQYEER